MRFVVVLVSVLTFGCGGPTKEELQVLTSLRDKPLSLDPSKLTYAQLNEVMSVQDRGGPSDSVVNAYRAHWFDYFTVFAFFFGRGTPSPDAKSATFELCGRCGGLGSGAVFAAMFDPQGFRQKQLPVSLLGIWLGQSDDDAILVVQKAYPAVRLDKMEILTASSTGRRTARGPGWTLSWELDTKDGRYFVANVRWALEGVRFQ